jgi:hypothetical protein
VRERLEALGDKGDRIVLDIPPERGTQWRIGAPVTVHLSGEHLTVTPAECSFEWNGRENLVSFVVRVADDAPAGTVQVCFHVFLSGLPIAFIPVGVTIAREVAAQPAGAVAAEVKVPSSVFASYASRDNQEVARRLSTLAHWAPRLDIFQDCLDLEPNGDYRSELVYEIATRDVFLLFWSRNAAVSDWVRWELKTAQETRGTDAILPMPLEDPSIAPPPPGLEGRHMRDRFMIAGYGLSKIGEAAGTRSPAG